MPSTAALLRGVYGGRMSLAIAIYLTAALKVRVAAPLDILVTSLLLLMALAVTGSSYWYTHVRGRPAGRTFLYLQAVFDVVLVTTVVHITGGPESDFTGFYVVLLAVTAVLMPPVSTALVTVLAGLVYFADVFFGHQVAVGPGLWIQLGVFAAVAVVTTYIASRVSVMGAEREVLAGELRQVRLEAGDVLRNIRSGVVTVDGQGRALCPNPAAEELLGFNAEDWIGQSVMPEFARIAPEFWAAVTATARRGVRLMRVEATVRRPDRTFPIGVTTTTLDQLTDEGPPRVTAIFTDISDSKRLEELHLRAERLEAVAELSSSLAHEIKNPLASIRSSVEQLGRSSRANPDEKFLSNRVVSNLVLNAVQAAGAKATVKVRTGLAAANELPGAAGIENPVALRVSDNGPGIPADLQHRLFEPFSTGRVGGTGLGLAIVQRAVEAHRGLVLVDTKPGGTTFSVYFPAARRKEEAA